MTAVVPEVDVLAHLDFAFTPPCDLEQCPHGNPPAEWVGVMHCGCRWLICTPCKDDTDAAVAKLAGLPAIADECVRCGKPYVGPIEGVVARIEPLP